jgi:hypothetical protein
VDADAEPHLLADRSISILPTYGVLNLDGTLHDIYDAGKVGDPDVRRSGAIDDDPVSREGAERADLISPHQSTIALDIRREDRGQLPFDGLRFQGSAPPRSSISRPDARSESL